MQTLSEFLSTVDVGVESTGDEVHIGMSVLDHILGVVDALDVVTPTIAVGEASTVGFATVAGVGLAVAGPIVGMVGIFMALGAPYEEAETEIKNEATANGFSQGLVAGFLRMSGSTVNSLFVVHDIIPHNEFDPHADVVEANAYNRGLVAGFTLAKYASDEEKKSFVLEIRQFTGDVAVGDWQDRDKINYVIEYAAKLRLNYL